MMVQLKADDVAAALLAMMAAIALVLGATAALGSRELVLLVATICSAVSLVGIILIFIAQAVRSARGRKRQETRKGD